MQNFFVPETLIELKDFLLYLKNLSPFIIGAGSNLLISENIQNRIFIKLGKNFNKISLTKDNVIIAGCFNSRQKCIKFCMRELFKWPRVLSCIPGSIGGGIRMNSGCFGKEFKDVLLSVQVMDLNGNVHTINSKNIRSTIDKQIYQKILSF